MEVSFTTLSRKESLFLSAPMATTNFNSKLSLQIISSSAPVPTFASITHSAPVNFNEMQTGFMCSRRDEREQNVKKMPSVDNSENENDWNWRFSSECRRRIPPSASSLDSPKSIPGYEEWRIDDKEEVKKLEGSKKYKKVKKVGGDKSPDVFYKDFKRGEGHTVTDSNLLWVSFHYDKYDKNKKQATNEKITKRGAKLREPRKMYFCKHNEQFGEEFMRGMRGMRSGGIRRIIIDDNEKDPNVFDVELLQVCPSLGCRVINFYH